MKLLKSAVFVLVLIGTFVGSASIAQAVQERKNTGYKWEDKSAVIEFYMGLAGKYPDSVRAAMATWNSITDYNTHEQIVPMVLTSDKSCPNTINGAYYEEGSDVLGATEAFYNTETGIIDYVTIDINMNRPLWFGASFGRYDVESIILHELGHALGIAHCHEKGEICYSQTCTSNVMRPTLNDNTLRRTLTEYDISSKQIIYW